MFTRLRYRQPWNARKSYIFVSCMDLRHERNALTFSLLLNANIIISQGGPLSKYRYLFLIIIMLKCCRFVSQPC